MPTKTGWVIVHPDGRWELDYFYCGGQHGIGDWSAKSGVPITREQWRREYRPDCTIERATIEAPVADFIDKIIEPINHQIRYDWSLLLAEAGTRSMLVEEPEGDRIYCPMPVKGFIWLSQEVQRSKEYTYEVEEVCSWGDLLSAVQISRDLAAELPKFYDYYMKKMGDLLGGDWIVVRDPPTLYIKRNAFQYEAYIWMRCGVPYQEESLTRKESHDCSLSGGSTPNADDGGPGR